MVDTMEPKESRFCWTPKELEKPSQRKPLSPHKPKKDGESGVLQHAEHEDDD